ncbi:unnamed protein product [Gongylonema pulchrum]|uniref:PH domain-containing protein n=1 Tax=Gongylonema pulchrum TaxID=637853 RepID=A0A183D2P9_9BILA|nr:unnamed protein product [Gongylonema pulchrum]
MTSKEERKVLAIQKKKKRKNKKKVCALYFSSTDAAQKTAYLVLPAGNVISITLDNDRTYMKWEAIQL